MIPGNMSISQIKMRTHKIAHDVGPISNHCRRTLHRHISFFKTTNTAYPNKQQDRIHVQSCSYILIQTNTFHLKTCFRSKSTLQYILLGSVRHEIAQSWQQKTLSKFNTIQVPCSKLILDYYSKTCTTIRRKQASKYTILFLNISTYTGHLHGGG